MGLFGDLTDLLGVTNYGDAEAAQKAGLQGLQNVNLPSLSPIELQQLVESGKITPAMAETVMLQKSKMEDVSTAPELRNAQMNALNQMQDIASQGGLTAVDRARLNDISQQVSTEQRGAREAILQGAQRRGTLTGGATLLDQMLGQQAAATRQNTAGVNVAAEAQRRALEAIQNTGAMGGNIRSQDFSEASQKAAAADAIAKFNAQNQQSVGLTNTAAQNAAQAANIQNDINRNTYNTEVANKAKMYNAGIPQQNYQNELGKATAVAGGQNSMADMYNKQSQANIDLLKSGASAAAGGFSGSALDTQKKKATGVI